MKIIGISALYHDSAVTFINDGKIIEAIQEERLTRVKHDASFPEKSLKYIFQKYRLKIKDIDSIVFYDKPFLKFERLIETYLASAPRGFKTFKMSMPIWLNEKLFLKSFLIKYFKKLDKNFNKDKLFFSEHHLSHAASAFFPSPFNEAVILTVDGVGEWATSTVSIGSNNSINIKKEINFPHSLGLLYSAFTYYCGFKVNSGEYKLMGLAPYGENKYSDIILRNIIDVKDDGSFRLDLKYFDYITGLKMVNKEFCNLFGKPARRSEEDKIEQFHMDIAASIQNVLEIILLKITKSLYNEYGIENLCLAGGVALNCVANGKILKKSGFKNIWIQPASGDAGGSLGASLAYWHLELGKGRILNKNDNMNGSYLGSEYSNNKIKVALEKKKLKFKYFSNKKLISKLSELLLKKKTVGLFQGRMEFGPRALGNRSIIADPRDPSMQKKLNLQIKFRESFRPFAPIVLREDVNKWFELSNESPYMLVVEKVKKSKRLAVSNKNLFGINLLNEKRSLIPAVTHVDYSARIQTVHKNTNKFLHDLLTCFKMKTKCPILVNTSFNIRGEPIVESPNDSIKCFLGTNLDVLCIGNFILLKEEQSKDALISYQHEFKLD
tara:strand:- start:716 stop:2542 length:1827 start_codon:yes stop_codon:yes gene_type:complete